MVMEMDSEYFMCDENHMPTKTEMEQFLKKHRLLTKGELDNALRVTSQDFLAVLNQLVPCVGCRRSAEALYQQVTDCGIGAFYPLCIDPQGTMFLAKERMQRSFLYSLFHCPSQKMQTLMESLSKCKSGRRCTLHSLESQRIRTVSSWVDVWDYMDEKCQERVVLVDSKCLMDTLERYLRKHRFCTECRSKVLRAYNILIGEVDPSTEHGYIPQLYEGIECCKNQNDRHLHVLCKTEFVSRLIAKAVPELVGSRRERHAKTMEIAQEEVLTCLGLCVFERLHRIQNRFREEERTWEIIMCIATQALRRGFEMAVEKKLGISQLELLCEELSKEEQVKQQRKELKKQKRKRKKEKKAEEIEMCQNDCEIVEEIAELVEDETEEKENCLCENFESEKTGKKKKKKSGKGKGKNKGKESMSDNIPLVDPIKNEDESKLASETSTLALSQSSRCSSETSRDCGYSSGNNNDNASCSSPEGSEIACSDGFCNHNFGDCSSSRANDETDDGKHLRVGQRLGLLSNSYPIPYRSLEEQLEASCDSEDEEDCIPEEEVRAILTPTWGSMREKEREKIRRQFEEMISRTSKSDSVTGDCCSVRHPVVSELCQSCCEEGEQVYECGTENKNEDKETSCDKKSQLPRQGGMNINKPGHGQGSKKYKGKNRR